MSDQRPRRARRLKVLGAIIALALVVLCCVPTVLLSQRIVKQIRRAPFMAALACAHGASTSATSAPSPSPSPSSSSASQTSLVVAVNSIRYDYQRRGASNSNSALCVVRADDGAIVQHYALGEGVLWNLVQADGVIYYRLRPSDEDVQVCALRASDWTRLWCQTSRSATRLNSPRNLPLIVSSGILYIQDLTRIAAVRASDGTALWQYAIDAIDPSYQYGSGITVANDSIYVPSFDAPDLGGRRQVCALRAANGTTRWCTELGALPNFYKVVADSTGVYVVSHENRALEAEIVALSPADGAIQWRRAIQTASGSEGADTYGAVDANSFTVQNGLLYLVTTDSNRAWRLVALRASDGTTRWELATDKPPTILVRGDVAYLANESVSPRAISLQALQASTGKPLWQRSIDTTSQLLSQVSEMVADGEMLYVLDREQDHLYAIEAGDGQMRWERTRYPCYATGVTPLPEPHSENGVTVWCGWDTDRVSDSYGVSAPNAMPFLLAAGT